MMGDLPHLTDQESVRREAAAQYGGLSDAASMIQAHAATLDQDVAAAHKRKIDPEETKKVQADLSLAQDKVDGVHGDGTYKVLDAVVRGDALSTVVEDGMGNTHHLVVGWTDRWKSIVPKAEEAAARSAAATEAAAQKLGAEARAEVAKLVAKAREEITAEVSAKFAELLEGERQKHADAVQEAAEAEEGDKPVRDGSASRTEGAGGNEVGEDVDYPSTHDELDALATEHNFVWPEGVAKVAEKQDALRTAGIAPAAEEE